MELAAVHVFDVDASEETPSGRLFAEHPEMTPMVEQLHETGF